MASKGNDMDAVYVNNYRGFSKTTLPILPVNFFVGENSTGKTSLLALLELLANHNFWFRLDFNLSPYEFGGYKDIVSIGSSDQREFQLGLLERNDKDPTESMCYMMHFREGENGLPKLVFLSHYCNGQLATMWLSRTRVGVRLQTGLPPLSDWPAAEDVFGYLQEEPARPKIGYKFLPPNGRSFARRSPITALPGYLSELFGDTPCAELTESIGFPLLAHRFAGLAPIRTTPRRTYDGYAKPWSADGQHTPYVIRSSLSSNKQGAHDFVEALNTFGDNSGLFQTIGVKKFGRTAASPFELNVSLGGHALRVNSVGYGVSQVLPVAVEALVQSRAWLAIQQPEVHLHPKAQAALGNLLYQAAYVGSNTLFVETHSDYILDRFRLAMREGNPPSNFAHVCYFERSAEINKIHFMRINELGEYPEDQPKGFREFFLMEQKKLLGL